MISSPTFGPRSKVLLVVMIATLLAPIATGAQQATSATANGALAVAAPEAGGMSAARLARLTSSFKKEVEDKKLPGVVMLVARKGKVVYTTALGARDPKRTDAMRPDAIFRIYSMTKPMASVATMILVEDGTLQLTDPVSKWLPVFKDVKVSTPGGDVPAQRPMTVQDLLRHTAGLAYGELTQNTAVKDALAQAGLYKPGVIDFDIRDMTGAEQVERLAKIPLIHQPGTTWEYSLASDVLGRVVEAASGKRLGDFMSERLFKPLKMNDTAFWVTEAKMARLAEAFDKDPLAGTPIKLIDVSGELTQNNGTVTRLKAKHGLLENKKGELELFDGIEIDGTDGTTARLKRAMYYSNEGRVVSTDPVTATTSTGSVQAAGIAMNNKTKLVQFRGDVSVRLLPQQGQGLGPGLGTGRDSHQPVDFAPRSSTSTARPSPRTSGARWWRYRARPCSRRPT